MLLLGIKGSRNFNTIGNHSTKNICDIQHDYVHFLNVKFKIYRV